MDENTATEAVIPDGYFAVSLGEGFGDSFGNIYKKAIGEKYLLGFRVLAKHLNHTGACHGASIALFADMQLMAVKHQTPYVGQHMPTKNLNIDYIAPIGPNAWVEMDVDLVRMTRTTMFSQALMRVNGKVAVRATASYHIPQQTKPLGD